MVRPPELGPDISHGWGARRSVAEDYLFDQPVLLGSLRVGPDLANYGHRASVDGILLRLYNPRIIVAGSVMPRYSFLFDTRKVEGATSPDALALPDQFAPATGYEVIPRPKARALAAYLMSLRQDGYLFEVPPPPLPKTNAPATNAITAPTAAKK
jgi:cytochrome c oxidase cbb3-type subunit 2